ncbi:ABC transporter substrate-binding protein [Aliidongia dinghuensis]|uniref:ABC transporter substrate-binding protein n=1 Tax=Aliidongia dinghuensis TaxID=1867774 RepID=A0A8J3E3R4_9PROT|nr:ABC transporter substrate-binding protein [Aliidongia dinghuensis]GGF20970.1 ABC transporter substrate-binding protein [Aliidongia dinghuensis]
MTKRHRLSRRPAGTVLGLAAGALTLSLAGPATAADNEVVVASWGGSIQEVLTKVLFDPFSKETGIHVTADDTSTIGKAEAMAKSGNIAWDVFMASDQDVTQAEADHLLLPLDWKVIPKADLTPGAATDDAVASYTYGTVMTYNTKQVTKPPRSWAEWWNTETYSCRRTMRNVPVDDLEMAVMSSGVEPAKVYPVDLKLAYKQLDKIQPSIVNFWDTGAQSVQLVAEGTACLGIAWNNRVVAAIKDGQPIGFVWDGALIHHDYYTVLKGAPHAANAMKLIAYAMRPDVQAKIANAIALVPVNNQAFSQIDPAMAKNMPTQENLTHALVVDMGWWTPNMKSSYRQFSSWLTR